MGSFPDVTLHMVSHYPNRASQYTLWTIGQRLHVKYTTTTTISSMLCALFASLFVSCLCPLCSPLLLLPALLPAINAVGEQWCWVVNTGATGRRKSIDSQTAKQPDGPARSDRGVGWPTAGSPAAFTTTGSGQQERANGYQ